MSGAGPIASDLPLCGPCSLGNCAGHGRFFVNGQLEPCSHDHPMPECNRAWDTEEAHATWHHRCNLPLRHEGTHSCRDCGAETKPRRFSPTAASRALVEKITDRTLASARTPEVREALTSRGVGASSECPGPADQPTPVSRDEVS